MATSPEKLATDLVSNLRGVLGDRAKCAILYGSVPRGEYVPGASDVNVMVLVDDINTNLLTAAAPIASKWTHEGHTPPLIIELEQWRRAADVFAIELADMRDAHQPLFGDDCVANEVVRNRDLRTQAERELRGKLLHLQTGMLMAASTPEVMGELLKKALPSFTTYLRAALRLAGQTVPSKTPETIRAGAKLVGAAPDAWLEIWEARLAKKKLKLGLSDSIVEQYHTAAERTAVFVDNLREDGQ